MIQLLRTILITLSLAGMIIPTSLAQDQQSTATSGDDGDVVPRTIEEINVVRERTIFTLRMEIESTETEVYGLFNELNSNDEFDVTCINEVFTGSHFPKRVCMADYLRKEQARNAGGSQTSLDVNGVGIELPLSLQALEGEVRHKTIAMEAEMLKLAQENRSFANALLRLTELMGLLQVKKEQNPFHFGSLRIEK